MENYIKKYLKNIIYSLDIVLFLVIVCTKILIFGRSIEENYFSYKSLMYPSLASLLVLVSLSLLFKRKGRMRFLLFLDIFISILIICDLNYLRYFKDILSIAVIKNSMLLGPVKSSISNLFKLTDLYFLIDIIFVLILYFLFKNKTPQGPKFIFRLPAIFLFLAIGVGINANYYYKLSVEQPRLITTMYNRVYICKKLGLVNTHAIDIYNALMAGVTKNIALPKDKQNEINTFLQANSTETSSNLKGIAKGKNLIVIQVEALQQFVINNKVQNQEITPNLNKFINRSEYFDNYYYQISAGGTSDAEFMSNNSLYPAPSGAAYYLYYGNEFNSLPKALKAQGYNTNALHGFREAFWNRNVMYKAEGFDKFYSEKDYNIDENVGLGLSDKSFLNQTVDKIQSLKKPYYSFVITLSSHFPFDDVAHYGQFNVGQYENTLLGNYLKAIHYTDEQLGMFLKKLDDAGITKDSVIVIYGDHNAIPRDKENQLAQFMNISSMNDLEWSKLQKVPMIIHFPNEEQKGINHITSGEMDLYPTLANIMGLPIKDVFGKDLFNTKDNTVIFRNGSFTDGKSFYAAPSDTYYDMKTSQKTAETTELKNKKLQVQSELGYSDDILKHNLFKNLNKDK